MLRDNLSELFKVLRHIRVDIFGSISLNINKNMITVENIMQFLTVIGQFVIAYHTFYCLTILCHGLYHSSFLSPFSRTLTEYIMYTFNASPI